MGMATTPFSLKKNVDDMANSPFSSHRGMVIGWMPLHSLLRRLFMGWPPLHSGEGTFDGYLYILSEDCWSWDGWDGRLSILLKGHGNGDLTMPSKEEWSGDGNLSILSQIGKVMGWKQSHSILP